MTKRPRRRDVLAAGAAATLLGALPRAAGAQAGEELVAAARKEGVIHYLSAGDLLLVQKIANAFEAKYPGIKVQAERLGGERIFQRLDLEQNRGIYNVDVVDSSEQAHFLVWKRQGWLAPFVPDEVAKRWPESERDPDGMFATFRASMAIMGHNTKLVPPADAPKGFADLLDPKWARRIVMGHPGYSGTVTISIYLLARELGWDYLKSLAKQRIMQVQSATEPPKKIAAGERPVMLNATDYVLFDLKEKGNPVEAIYPVEGCPLIPIPSAVMAKAPHPNAARLFQSFVFTKELQQLLVEAGNSRAFHPEVKEKAGRRPFSEIKLWRADPAALLVEGEEVRRKYSEIFGT
jgi:iron(III) transport system substrate-binding protein